MNTKPILLWPKARSEIALHLDRDDDDFLVLDTNSTYELQKLYNLRRDLPIFDPFPNHGKHYREFIEHVTATDCRCHIAGIEVCQDVLNALKDPLLARCPIEEVFSAVKPAGYSSIDAGSPLFSHRPMSVDWSYLNWANTVILAILVFAGTMIGSAVSPNGSLLAAITATFLFAVAYVCVRAPFSKLFSSVAGQFTVVAKTRLAAKH